MKTIILFSVILLIIGLIIIISRQKKKVEKALEEKLVPISAKSLHQLSFEIVDQILIFTKEWQNPALKLVGKSIQLGLINGPPSDHVGQYSAFIDSISEDEGRLILNTSSSFSLEEGTIEANLKLEAKPYKSNKSYSIVSVPKPAEPNIIRGTGIYEEMQGRISIIGILEETASNQISIKCEVNIEQEE